MSLRKRLSILYAALTQKWDEETCDECGQTWWRDRRHPHSGGWCMDCETEHFEAWKQGYELRQQRTKGAA